MIIIAPRFWCLVIYLVLICSYCNLFDCFIMVITKQPGCLNQNSLKVLTILALFFFLNTFLFFRQTYATPVLQQRAMSFMHDNKYDSAAVYFKLYYESLVADSLDPMARTAFHTGRSLARSGEYDEAIMWFRLSASHFRELGNMDNYWVAMGNLSLIYQDLGKYEEAVALSEETFSFFQQENDTLEMGKTLNNLALNYYRNQQTDKAIEVYLRSIELLGNRYPDVTSKAYNQLGNIWAMDLDDERKALSYYLKSLDMKKRLGDPASLSVAYNNVGISYKNLQMPDSALVNYHLALDYAEESGRAYRISDPLINLGKIYALEGEQEKALQYLLRAEEMSDKLTFRQKIIVWNTMGDLFLEREDHNRALTFFSRVENLALSENAYDEWVDVLPGKASAYAGLKDFERAFGIQKQFQHVSDSLTINENRQVVADLMVKYEIAEKELTLLETEKLVQEKELKLKNRTLWILSALGLVMLVSGLAFTVYRQKKAVEKQALLQLNLAEQKSINKIQEDRLSISRELHDNIGSQLTFVNAGLEQFLHTETPPSQSQLKLLNENLTQSMRELRKTVWLISKTSASIDEIGLKLRDILKPIEQNGHRIEVIASGTTDIKLNELQTTHVFRIIQEATNNAVQHASCSKIVIRLKTEQKGVVFISVEDDGSGFDENVVQKSNGLKNMQYRAEQIQGLFHTESRPGRGTVISFNFPVA